jgi:diacylglycerol diphosphate phosphatase / phosphatidate phosphatase
VPRSRRLDPAVLLEYSVPDITLAMAADTLNHNNETYESLAEEAEEGEGEEEELQQDQQPAATAATNTGSSSSGSSLQSSCCWSPEWEELAASIVFFVLCMIPSIVNIAPRIRPIPFQRIQSGEYILNLVNNNESIDSDTVSTLGLVFVSVLLPFGIQLVHVAYTARRGQRPRQDKLPLVLHTVCVYLVGFGLTMLVTETLKSYIGYLRPSFYDLCEPSADYTVCTAADAGESSDARKSFPSGHASTAFCGLLLFSKHLERSFGIESVRKVAIIVEEEEEEEDTGLLGIRYKTGSSPIYNRFYSILCLLPVALAIFIAASRVVDNKHFPADIVGGSLLGAACAHFANRLWFPSLIS